MVELVKPWNSGLGWDVYRDVDTVTFAEADDIVKYGSDDWAYINDYELRFQSSLRAGDDLVARLYTRRRAGSKAFKDLVREVADMEGDVLPFGSEYRLVNGARSGNRFAIPFKPVR